MNERIDQLIEQCTTQQFSDCVGGYETFDKEKFAELIVRQCLFEMMHECVTNPSSSISIQDFMTVVAKRIQTSFGVE